MPMGKKKIALLCLLLVVAVSPLVLLSTWCIRKFENQAVQHPERSGSPRLLLRVAWIYKSSFRPDDAKRAYQSFYAVFPEHPEAIDAHWRYVLLVKDTESRQNTGEQLRVFVHKWGGTPQYKLYEKEVQRTFFYIKRL